MTTLFGVAERKDCVVLYYISRQGDAWEEDREKISFSDKEGDVGNLGRRQRKEISRIGQRRYQQQGIIDSLATGTPEEAKKNYRCSNP